MEIMLNMRATLLKKVKENLKKEGITQDQIVTAYFKYIANHQQLPFHNTLNDQNLLNAEVAKRFDKYDQKTEESNNPDDDNWYSADTWYITED